MRKVALSHSSKKQKAKFKMPAPIAIRQQVRKASRVDKKPHMKRCKLQTLLCMYIRSSASISHHCINAREHCANIYLRVYEISSYCIMYNPLYTPYHMYPHTHTCFHCERRANSIAGIASATGELEFPGINLNLSLSALLISLSLYIYGVALLSLTPRTRASSAGYYPARSIAWREIYRPCNTQKPYIDDLTSG